MAKKPTKKTTKKTGKAERLPTPDEWKAGSRARVDAMLKANANRKPEPVDHAALARTLRSLADLLDEGNHGGDLHDALVKMETRAVRARALILRVKPDGCVARTSKPRTQMNEHELCVVRGLDVVIRLLERLRVDAPTVPADAAKQLRAKANAIEGGRLVKVTDAAKMTKVDDVGKMSADTIRRRLVAAGVRVTKIGNADAAYLHEYQRAMSSAKDRPFIESMVERIAAKTTQ